MTARASIPAEKHRDQVQAYADRRPLYSDYARVLRSILERITEEVAPLAIVQTRAKDVDSFAEKAVRKRDKYADPVNEFTDLCGGRVITHTQTQVRQVCEQIESRFRIDPVNSEDVRSRLKAGEFGYLSVHYVVQLDPDYDYGPELSKFAEARHIELEHMYPLKAEVQVRTLLQHAWADVVHDRLYKSESKVPVEWQRVSSRLAAVLEDADHAFERLVAGVDNYRSYFGAYMSDEAMAEEIDLLKTMLKLSPGNPKVALRLAKMAHAAGKWDQIIHALESAPGAPRAELEAANNPALLRELGNALCQKHADQTRSQEYKRGQAYLHQAVAANPKDADSWSLLAASWEPRDTDLLRDVDTRRHEARKCYRTAHELEPENPYHLSSCLEFELEDRGDIGSPLLLRQNFERAISRCREHIAAGIEFPRAHFTIGRLSLLLGREFQSLSAYAKAIRLCMRAEGRLDEKIIDRETKAIARISHWASTRGGSRPEALEWARTLLVLARAVVAGEPEILRDDLRIRAQGDIQGPVVILAGGCDPKVERNLRAKYGAFVVEAFKDFRGTVVSGGTAEGVSGIAGGLKDAYPNGEIELLGYVPTRLPTDASKDLRFRLLQTAGDDFSPLEPLRSWSDIVVSGIDPAEVKLIGIEGGNIAGFEYQLAVALGARVALIQGSGRKADEILQDPEWADEKNLAAMPMDPMTLRVFIGSKGPEPYLQPDERERLAQAVHKEYLKTQIESLSQQLSNPSLAPWDELQENLKESNRAQVDDIARKLELIECRMEEIPSGLQGEKPFAFTGCEIELLAQMEHARWNMERLFDGWRYAEEKDVNRRRTPYLVGWDDLPEGVKEWDRHAVRDIPRLLATVGLRIQRTQRSDRGQKNGSDKPADK